MLKEEGLGAAEIENILYHRSGLLGMSGVSADMRDLHAKAGISAEVTQALDLFVYRFAQQAGGMMAALQGWTGWCSPQVLASMTPSSVPPCARGWAGRNPP